MRTTIDIPDDLYRRAKIRAAELGITLNELLNRAFERALGVTRAQLGWVPPPAKRPKKAPSPTSTTAPAPTEFSALTPSISKSLP